MKKKPSEKGYRVHNIPSSLFSLRGALLLLLADVLLGVGGYTLTQGYNLIDAIYMTIITISTVGYTEVQPLSPGGKLMNSLFILLNIGVITYILAVFSYYIIEGKIFKNMEINIIKSNIDKLQDHVILCGYGRYGKEAAAHFRKQQVPFVVIDHSAEEMDELGKNGGKILYIQDDATHDEVLISAGIKRASALITALPDDSDNLFIVLTARQLNPNLNIISRAKDPRSQRKLLLAGASHVVMPEQIGGFYMATLVSLPGAMEFFSYLTNDYRTDIGFEEIIYEHLPDGCKGKSIRELRLRHATGANIIGFKHADGSYEVNPDPDTVLEPESSFIVLGSREQLRGLRGFFRDWRSV